MKLTFEALLLHLVLYCVTQVFGVQIQSVPASNTDGVIEIELNKTVSLVCQSDGSPHTGEDLVWLRNDAPVSLKEGNKQGRSSVCVTPAIYEDNGATFTCHLSNNKSSVASVTLNVTYGPRISGSEKVTVEQEATLLLQCDIRANPSVLSVSWKRNGTKVNLKESGLTETNDGFISKISTNNVEKSLHEGTYQCSADSPMFGEHTKIFYVTVTDKTFKFPLFPMIAALVVVGLTAFFAVIARWEKIVKIVKCRK